MEQIKAKNQNNSSTTFRSISNKDQYISLSHKSSKKILVLFKQPIINKDELKFQKTYNSIIGSLNYSNKSPFINTHFLLQTLKNINSLSGHIFIGKRFIQLPSNPILSSFQLKLSSIQQITFQNFKVLDFTYCNLDNIEALSFLDMKNLEQLKLSSNRIVSLKPLTKTAFINLKDLKIYFNSYSYHSLNHLHRSHSPQLQSLYVQKQYKQKCIKDVCEALNQLKKMEKQKRIKNWILSLRKKLDQNQMDAINQQKLSFVMGKTMKLTIQLIITVYRLKN